MSKKNKKNNHKQNNDTLNEREYIKDTSPIVYQKSKLKSELHIRIRPDLTDKQKELLKLINSKECKMIFVEGPAGTSKSFCALLAGLQLLSDKKVSDILYLRSIVEASENKIGFLPGDENSKCSPYLQVLMEKLDELLMKSEADMLIKEERIQGHPINFIRGASWNNKVIIADECIYGEHFLQTSTGKIKLKSLFNKFKNNKEMPLLNTYNETTKSFEYKPILNVVNKGHQPIVELIMGNRTIKCTSDHKFLTEAGWVDANMLSTYNPIIANNEPKMQTLDVMNDDQFQIFLGSYLGDGHVQKVGENRFRLQVLHGAKQRDYCKWKADLFHSELTFVEKNGYAQTPAFKFLTKCFSLPFDIGTGKKQHCNPELLRRLDARGIAAWYMDDGNLNKAHNRIRLFTSSFDLESQHQFIKKFKEFDIDCSISEDRGDDYLYYYLNFNAVNSRKLMELVRPYIHDNINYKLDSISEAPYVFNNKFLSYRHIILDKIINNNQLAEVFDVEVKDNHNFIITSGTCGSLNSNSGIVAHNCQNMTAKELFTLITRCGEFTKVLILGDPDQSDINGKSGFAKMISMLDDEDSRANGIFTWKFTEDDVVRSKLVKFLLKKLKSKI